MAPNGLLDQRIGEAVTLAVISAVDTIVDRKIQPRVQDTLGKIFVSYRDCVIEEQKTAEAEFAASLLANRSSAEADFKDEIYNTTSASIATLNAALSSATTAFKNKRASVVELIKKVHQNSSAPTLVPFTPPHTGLETMVDNATPVGATRVAWADAQSRHQPAQAADDPTPASSPTASNQPPPPPDSPEAAAAWERAQHGGAHTSLPDPSLWKTPTNPYTPSVDKGSQASRDGAPPVGPYPPYFALGSRARYNDATAHYGGAPADHDCPFHPSGYYEQAPSPSGSSTHSLKYPPEAICSESSNQYHCGPYGLHEDFPLTADYLGNIGFTDPDVHYKIIHLHRIIHQGWHNCQYNSFGPQEESILKSTAFSTRLLLDKFEAPSIVNWYERLTSTCKAFRIGLVAFNAIQFSHRQEGLCIPGLGHECYQDMASALCTAMPMCLTQADNRVQAMIAGVKIKTWNGYEIVWSLLCRYVPGFNPTNTVNKPTWGGKGGNMIQYAAAFDLYFRLSSKWGSCHNDLNKSILFLKGITARNLLKLVEPFIIAIESMQGTIDDDSDLPDEYLPHYLHVKELAQKIAKRCKVEPFDWDLGGRPRVCNLRQNKDASSPASDLEDDGSRYAEPIDGHMQGYVVPTIAQARQPNGQPGRRMPNTTYSRKPDPLQCMQPHQPQVTCDACGKKGHSANTCDFLAVLIFLQRYLKNGITTKETIAEAERQWVERWKDMDGPPGRTPSKVYQVFTEHSGLTLDQMEAKMDWLCWPATSNE
jgi:hypothetical protein